jgi:hypothetical protein
MKNTSKEHEDELLAIIRYTGMEQTPTWSGTDQSSIGSMKEKEKAEIQTTTEASACNTYLSSILSTGLLKRSNQIAARLAARLWM